MHFVWQHTQILKSHTCTLGQAIVEKLHGRKAWWRHRGELCSYTFDTWSAVPCSGLSCARDTWSSWRESSEGPQRWLMVWGNSHEKRLRELRLFRLEKAQGISSMCTTIWREAVTKAELYSVQWCWQDQRKWTQIKIQEILSKHQEKRFYSEGDQALAQMAQRDCRVFILGYIQKSPGHAGSRWP